MTPFSKKFTKAYAKVLLRIAAGDLASAATLVKYQGGRTENAAYLIQQAVEKALKAVLCHCDLAVPLTHDITALLAALPENLERPAEETSLPPLSEFATIRRYEEGFYELTQQELLAALTAGSQLINWATKIINGSKST